MATETDSMRFPLPDDQLPRVEIDPQTIAEWKAEAYDTIHSLMTDRDSWFYRFDTSNPGFTKAYDKNGIRGCVRTLPEANQMQYLAQGVLHTTLKDVVYALKCETTHQLRSMFAQLYQTIGLDSAILQLCEGATAEDPFKRVAMVWAAIHPDMASARDYLHFEVSCTTKDAFGRAVLVNYRKSHDLRPDQLIKDHGLDIARRRTHGIITYRADWPGRVIMTSMGHLAVESKLSSWIFKIIMPALYKRTLNYHGLLEAKALQEIGLTAETLAKRSSVHAVMCRVCRKSFGMTRHRNWCQGCGHAVCRQCNMKIALLKEGVLLGPRLPVVLARFCMRCMLHANEQRIKRDMHQERMVAIEQPQQVGPSESFDESCIDGLLNLHRDHFEDDDTLKLSMDRSFSSTTFATTGSEPDEEQDDTSSNSDSFKAEELIVVAASVAEHVAHLRQMHQEQQHDHHRTISKCQ